MATVLRRHSRVHRLGDEGRGLGERRALRETLQVDTDAPEDGAVLETKLRPQMGLSERELEPFKDDPFWSRLRSVATGNSLPE